ncbi:MAG: helix-hairpin-helix domain-containing protein [Flavobacteriaceae bacterium]|nr:helix-hairpin-helix domain-containing protein [Flavobacteriaceae bacterium]
MKFLKSHFWYNKSQRNGILLLILIIFILQLVYVFVDFSNNDILNYDVSEIDRYQAQIDSLKKEQKEKSKAKIYRFNPNFLTDFKAYQLGLNVEEIDRLLAYRKTGKYVNSIQEFQKITGVNDSLLHAISPLFKFPEWVIAKQNAKTSPKSLSNNRKIANTKTKDLNLATINDLKTIDGIGEKLAKRIITYRKLLQGYTFNYQLYEVYYLKKEVADRILKQFSVLKVPIIKKLNINSATFKEILKLPYIDYELTKKIYNFKDELGVFTSIEDLKKIDSFPLDKYDRITLYLTAD